MKYIIAAVLATAGVMLGVINVWQNAVAINDGAVEWNDLTAFVAAIACLSALTSIVAGAVRRRWPIAALCGFLIVMGCTVTSVHYTLTRVGGQANTSALPALTHNARLAQATENVRFLRGEVQAEAARGGCGRKCQDLKADLSAAQAALVGLGSRRVVDSAAEGVEAATGGLWAAPHYRVALPVIQAMTIEAGVAYLLFMSGQFFGLGFVARRRVHAEIVEPVDPIILALERAGGRVGSNNDLAELARIPAPRVTEKVKLLEKAGTVRTFKIGKAKVIELA